MPNTVSSGLPRPLTHLNAFTMVHNVESQEKKNSSKFYFGSMFSTVMAMKSAVMQVSEWRSQLQIHNENHLHYASQWKLSHKQDPEYLQ